MPAVPPWPFREEECRRVLHRLQAGAGHLENGHLAGGAEAVLDRPDDAVVVVALPLEVEHGVDDVLQGLGAGDGALLGDVADEEDGRAGGLGLEQEAGGALADLADAAGGGLQRGGVGRLDGVHDHQAGPARGQLGLDLLHGGLGVDQQAVGPQAQPLAAELDLPVRLLARDVEHAQAPGRDRAGDLEEQGGLAHARFAAEQHQGAGHDAAAQHPVELRQPGGQAGALLRFDPVVGHGLDPPARRGGGRPAAGRRGGGHFLHQAVPGAAVGAAPQPLGGAVAAALANKLGSGFCPSSLKTCGAGL